MGTRGHKKCSKCSTEQGVRASVCVKCGEPFIKKVKEIPVTVIKEPQVEKIDAVLEETLQPVKEEFKFKAYTGSDTQVGTIQKRKTYERPDIEIERLMKDPEVMRIYPVPAGVPVEKLTAREQAYQVLGLGKTRAKSLLTLAQMEKYWKTVDWKYVAEILGEKVVETKEPEVEENKEEEDKGE
jgi:hypothetical protein